MSLAAQEYERNRYRSRSLVDTSSLKTEEGWLEEGLRGTESSKDDG